MQEYPGYHLIGDEKSEMNNATIITVLFAVMGLVTHVVIAQQKASAYVTEEARLMFIRDCSSESGTTSPHLDILKCSKAKNVLTSTPGGKFLPNKDINSSVNTILGHTPEKEANYQKFRNDCKEELGLTSNANLTGH